MFCARVNRVAESAASMLIAASRVGPSLLCCLVLVLGHSRAIAAEFSSAVGEELPPLEARGRAIPEMLVEGSHSLNSDIRRTEDDIQPYVVFDAEEIQRSQVLTLNEFFRTRLPMNTTAHAEGQTTGSPLNNSVINLRGLGFNQTLILVDGRRVPGIGGNAFQGDINGIPLEAVERIEVLPSTSGGIYGGNATGGVINIILRRDYTGGSVAVNYADTFDAKVPRIRVDASGGFSLGRTHATVTASYSESGVLTIGERDFAQRSIDLFRRNDGFSVDSVLFPPLGKTVNIRSTTGEILTLDPQFSNGASLGSAFTHLPLGYAGPASDGGAALRANAGHYNLEIPSGPNGGDRGLMASPTMQSVVLNLRREFSSHIDGFVDLARFASFAESRTNVMLNTVSPVPANAPNNPFQQDIHVAFPTPGWTFDAVGESITLRGTAGIIARLPRDWKGGLDYSWNRSHRYSEQVGAAVDAVGLCVQRSGVAADVDPDGAGPLLPCNTVIRNNTADARPALNILQEGNTFPIDYTPYLLPMPNLIRDSKVVLTQANLRLAGPALHLPTGPLTVSFMGEHREERIKSSVLQNVASFVWTPARSQEVQALYLEGVVPLVDAGRMLPLLRELEVQASVRYDRYTTRGTANGVVAATEIMVPSRDGPFPEIVRRTSRTKANKFTLGFRYRPLADVALRGSFGTGFLPPNINQIAFTETEFPNNGSQPPALAEDRRRGNTTHNGGAPYTIRNGGNPHLKPEDSESLSLGIIFTPQFAPGLRLSVDYTWIDKTDEIRLPDRQFILDNEEHFPERVQRGPNLPSDPSGWAGPITLLDATYINISKRGVEAMDIQADYHWDTQRYGEFRAYAIATWQPVLRSQALPGAPFVDTIGFAPGGITPGQLEWRGNFGMNWRRGPMQLAWNAQYYNPYWAYSATATPAAIAQAIANQGSAKIPSQIYFDAIASYEFGAMSMLGGALANSEISLGIENLFDRSPPILAQSSASGTTYSVYGDPRLRRFSATFRKRF